MSFSDGGVGFGNPVIGGDGELVIDDVHSRGYTAGVSGWSIQRNGAAEFNDVSVRGTVTATSGENEVRVSASDPPWTTSPAITLNPDQPAFAPALIQAHDISDAENEGQLNIRSPYPINGDLSPAGDPAHLILRSDHRNTPFSGRFIQMEADTAFFMNGTNVSVNSGNVSLVGSGDLGIDQGDILMDNGSLTLWGTSGGGDINVVQGDVNVSTGLVRADVTGLVPFTFVNGWGNIGGQFEDCYFGKTATGLGFIVGHPSGGTATGGTSITRLPAAYVPLMSHTFIAPGNGGRITQVVVRGQSAGAQAGDVVLQNPDAGLTWFALGGMNWPLPAF